MLMLSETATVQDFLNIVKSRDANSVSLFFKEVKEDKHFHYESIYLCAVVFPENKLWFACVSGVWLNNYKNNEKDTVYGTEYIYSEERYIHLDEDALVYVLLENASIVGKTNSLEMFLDFLREKELRMTITSNDNDFEIANTKTWQVKGSYIMLVIPNLAKIHEFGFNEFHIITATSGFYMIVLEKYKFVWSLDSFAEVRFKHVPRN